MKTIHIFLYTHHINNTCTYAKKTKKRKTRDRKRERERKGEKEYRRIGEQEEKVNYNRDFLTFSRILQVMIKLKIKIYYLVYKVNLCI